MNREKLLDNILLTTAALIALANTLSLSKLASNRPLYGFVFLILAIIIALYLIKKDGSPKLGIIFFTVVLVNTSIQFWNGATSSAAFLYPILFIWLKKEVIKGPVLTIAAVLSAIEFLAPIVFASGIIKNSFSFSSLVGVLISSLIAGLVPLLSMFLVEFLYEINSPIVSYSKNTQITAKTKHSNFPEDIARSLIPLIISGTEAHGIFLFLKNKNNAWTMNEHFVTSANISGNYMLDYEDSLIQLMNTNTSKVIHISSTQLAATNSDTALPWYMDSTPPDWISLVQFRMNDVLHGFIVVDYLTKTARKNSTAFLIDAAFILSLSWNLDYSEQDNSFLAVCEDLEASTNISTAIHILISIIVSKFNNSTATVAVLEDTENLTIFESMGSFGDGRGWKKYSINEGIAGNALKKRQAFRRLKMGNTRTFSALDDPKQLVKSCCAIPLIERENLLGVLTVESGEEHRFTPEDLSLFKAYATVFSLAVSRNTMIDLNKKLRHSDRITGLPLFSSFHAQLKELVKDVRMRATSISVLAVDIIKFKRINQKFGYSIGDDVLRQTSNRLVQILSNNALISRCGSNTFLICLTGVDKVSADAFAVRIHEEFISDPIRIRAQEILIKICIGGASSHVDRMIPKLPEIAINSLKKAAKLPGFSTIIEVGPFYKKEL